VTVVREPGKTSGAFGFSGVFWLVFVAMTKSDKRKPETSRKTKNKEKTKALALRTPCVTQELRSVP
jgi:hypothetical protein